MPNRNQHDLDFHAEQQARDMNGQEWIAACLIKWKRERLIERARMEQAERKSNDEGED